MIVSIEVKVGADKVWPILSGQAEVEDGTVVRCEEMDIARRVDGALQVACAHPSHGMHPRYGELARKIAALRFARTDSGRCPACDGSGWLNADHPAAQEQARMAWFVGYYRGIALPERQRKPRPRAAAQTQQKEETDE